MGFKPGIQFLPLGITQAQGLGHGQDAVPDVLDELDALGGTQGQNIDHGDVIGHAISVSRALSSGKTCEHG